MRAVSGPTAELCRWVCSTQLDDLPGDVRKEALTLLCDQVGCMIATATLPSCRPVVDLMRELAAPGECSIIGYPLRTSLPNAALANGTIGHGDEVDSVGHNGAGHYGAVIVPVSLNTGQYVRAHGAAVMRAIALGSEVAARIHGTVDHGARDVFAPSIGAPIGVAVSTGLLLGLDANQMEHAIGVAASGASGLACAHQEELHQTKAFNHGRAAQTGVVAALLARSGFHGPREVLTTEDGFFDAFLGRREAGHEVVAGLGANYRSVGVDYKRYPVGAPDQTPLYGFLQLVKMHRLAADDIDRIELFVSASAFHSITTNQHPSVHLETILGLAAVHGDLTFRHVHDARCLEDARVRAFKDRVRTIVTARPEMKSKMQMELKVHTRAGRTLSLDLIFPPMTAAEIKRKFRSLAGLRLDAAAVEELASRLAAIESCADVAALVRGLEIPY